MGFFEKIASGLSQAVDKSTRFQVVKETAPNEIGVYVMYLHGKVKYVGRAIVEEPGQSPKGLRKRLQEHWRDTTSGKPELHQYRDQLNVSLIYCQTVDEVKRLEGQLIRKYSTVEDGWNLQHED